MSKQHHYIVSYNTERKEWELDADAEAVKYDNGTITYQIMGPLEKIPVGTRINKYGQTVPEKYTWIDPRTEERVMRRPDGTFTERGRGLYAYCIGEKGGSIWPLIDRELTSIAQKNIADPWA